MSGIVHLVGLFDHRDDLLTESDRDIDRPGIAQHDHELVAAEARGMTLRLLRPRMRSATLASSASPPR